MSLEEYTEKWIKAAAGQDTNIAYPLESDGFQIYDPQVAARLSPYWRDLIAVDDNTPALDFSASEKAIWEQHQNTTLSITQTSDIDSFIARIKCLSAHKDSFWLSFYPSYLQAITQNQRVKINGHALHKVKQLYLGAGARSLGFGYKCHVFFPHLKVDEEHENHLQDTEQEYWIDNIVLPSLREHLPGHQLHHLPRSWKEVVNKAKVKKEFQPNLDKGNFARSPSYHIPSQYLAPVTASILQRAQGGFRNPIFMITGHGLKHWSKRPTVQLACSDFLKHLDVIFDLNYVTWDSEMTWWDIGTEDMPENLNNTAITLLRKSDCLKAWTDLFKDPSSKCRRNTVENYSWAGTQAAGSISVQLSESNRLRREGGIVYNKAYNVFKDIFASTAKDYSPFEYGNLSALAYSNETIQKVHKLNARGNSVPPIIERKKIKEAWNATKRRVADVLNGNGMVAKQSFGARQELRVQHNVGVALAAQPTSGESPTYHLKYSTRPLFRYNPTSILTQDNR